MRDEDFAEELFRCLLHSLERVDNLDAAGLAAAARMDLCLDNDGIRAEFSGILHGLFDRECRLPVGTLTPYERRIALLWYS